MSVALNAPPPTSHPDEEILVAYANGQLDLGWRILLESHLSFCTACGAQIAEFHKPGGRWLEEAPETAPSNDLWNQIEARIDTLPSDDLAETPLPEAARAELEPRSRKRRWLRFPFSTLTSTRLWRDPLAQVELLLVRIEPGQIFPEHTHLGPEQVLVLAGGYEDQQGHFAAGDFAPYTPETSHAPRIDEDEPCWIVTRIEQGVRFHGWRGLLTRFVR